jgi:hypothetical protein
MQAERDAISNIILGERYGGKPKPPELLQSVIESKGHHITDIDKSFTEVEIEYGIKDLETLKHTIFMFREPMPEEADEKYKSEGDIIEITKLSPEDKVDVISGILAHDGKELDKIVVDEIVNKKSADNPLYLSLLLQRLLIMDMEDFTT